MIVLAPDVLSEWSTSECAPGESVVCTGGCYVVASSVWCTLSAGGGAGVVTDGTLISVTGVHVCD